MRQLSAQLKAFLVLVRDRITAQRALFGGQPAHIRAYVLSVTLLGALFVAAASLLYPPDTNGLIAIAFFVTLGIIAAASPIALPRGGEVTAAFAVQFGCIITQGTTAAVWVGWLCAAILLRRRPWYKIGFNAAESALTCGLAALAFQAAGGKFLALSTQPVSQYPLGLLAAGACYIVVNNLVIVTAVAMEQHKRLLGTWLAGFRWLIPQFCALGPFGILIAMVYQVRDVGPTGVALFLMPLFWARYAFTGYMEMRRVHEDTVNALITGLERYDPYTREHSERVVRMVEEIAAALAYPDHKMDALRSAALLHDIGKSAVMERVLRKKEKLTEEDWNLIKQHPGEGHDLVKEIEPEESVAQIVLETHERPDGKGYTNQLPDAEISLAAKIIAVADAFHAMESRRPYRDPLPLEAALQELGKGAGTQFDPDVVKGAMVALPLLALVLPLVRGVGLEAAILVLQPLRELALRALREEIQEVAEERAAGQEESARRHEEERRRAPLL